MLYKSMIAALPEYQVRKFDDIEKYFPNFNLTVEDVQNRLNDQKWASFILHNSPTTPYIEILRSQIAVNINHSVVSGKKDHIDIFLNTYPLKLNKMDQHIVGLFFAQEFGVRVTIIYKDPLELKFEDVIFYDEIYTYYLKELFSHEDIREGYTALKFVCKRLFVPKLFGKKFIKSLDTDREEIIIKTRCDILTTFTFFPVKLCSAISP